MSQKTFRFIRMHTKIIIAYSIEANNVLNAMKVLLKHLQEGLYVDKIKSVFKNVQAERYQWIKQRFPGGIIIVDGNSNKEVYQLEFADTTPCVILALVMDIEELKQKIQASR